jgi:hypothetical protein
VTKVKYQNGGTKNKDSGQKIMALEQYNVYHIACSNKREKYRGKSD